jgi:hypothetical protein
MSILYHGTNIRNGIIYSSHNALLSSFDIQLEQLRAAGGTTNPMDNKSLEKLASDLRALEIRRYEHKHDRAVIVTEDFDTALTQSKLSITENFVGKHLILGLNLDNSIVNRLSPDGDVYSLMIPRRLPLTGLVELYFEHTPTNLRAMKLAFGRFNPTYLQLSDYHEETDPVVISQSVTL